jgi:DNA-binding CsgD family transcriptional regulator
MQARVPRYGGEQKLAIEQAKRGGRTNESHAPKAKKPLGLFAVFRVMAPSIFGLGLTQLMRLILTNIDYTTLQPKWMNDISGLIVLAVLALPLLFVIELRPQPSNRLNLAVGYSSAAITVLALVIIGVSQYLGWYNSAVLISSGVLAYVAQIAGLYFWLQAARDASSSQAVIFVFSAVMVSDMLSHLLWVVFAPFCYQLSLLCALAILPCIVSYQRHGFPLLTLNVLQPLARQAVRPFRFFRLWRKTRESALRESPPQQPQNQGLLGLAYKHIPERQAAALTALGVVLLALSVGLLLGFVPDVYVNFNITDNAMIIYLAMLIREIIVNVACVFFIIRVLQGRLWELTVDALVFVALLALAVLPFNVLFAHLPLNLDVIVANSAHALLTGLVWYLIIFFMGRSARNPRRRFQPIAYAIAALYCYLLPRAFGRSILFPFLSTAHGTDLAVVFAIGLLLAAMAVFLSMYLRAALAEHQVNIGKTTLTDNLESEELAQLRFASMRHSAAEMGKLYRLSQRELEVLALYALGYTQKRIAKELFISPETVHTHIKNIYTKTNISSRQGLLDHLNQNL